MEKSMPTCALGSLTLKPMEFILYCSWTHQILTLSVLLKFSSQWIKVGGEEEEAGRGRNEKEKSQSIFMTISTWVLYFHRANLGKEGEHPKYSFGKSGQVHIPSVRGKDYLTLPDDSGKRVVRRVKHVSRSVPFTLPALPTCTSQATGAHSLPFFLPRRFSYSLHFLKHRGHQQLKEEITTLLGRCCLHCQYPRPTLIRFVSCCIFSVREESTPHSRAYLLSLIRLFPLGTDKVLMPLLQKIFLFFFLLLLLFLTQELKQ